MVRGTIAGLLIFLVSVTACDSSNSVPSPTLATPTLATPANSVTTGPTGTTAQVGSPNPTGTTGVSRTVTRSPTVTASDVITLTIWAPEDLAPTSSRGGQVLQHQIDEFIQGHPKIAVKYVLKSPYGKGGLLDYLVQTQALLPERLPDLTLLDSREIDAAFYADLLQPLDRDLPSGAFADLLPPAQAIAKYRGAWVAVPVTLDAQQLVSNPSAVKEPPASWDNFLAGNAAMVFPADGDDAFMLQYLHNGGHLPPASQAAALDVNTVATVLSFFQRAHAANLIPDSVFGIKTMHEVWPIFVTGLAPLAQVESTDYLSERDRVANSGFAPIPTQDGKPATLVSSWNYVVLASDPARHAAAAEFLNWMNDPARLAEWALAAKVIPARRSAFALAIKPRAYADFLLSLFDGAIVSPTFDEIAPYSDAWRNAVKSVLHGQATPSEAAARAAQSLGQ